MNIQDLYDLTSGTLIEKISSSLGLGKFVHRRAKFEGWLKVEIINSLCQKGFDALPEIDRIDVSFDKIGIELKTVNTNYRYKNAIKKGRPITKNVAGVIEDIENIKLSQFKHKFIVFVVFPVTHENKFWQKHLLKITCSLSEYRYTQFEFSDGNSGVIYYGQVKSD